MKLNIFEEYINQNPVPITARLCIAALIHFFGATSLPAKIAMFNFIMAPAIPAAIKKAEEHLNSANYKALENFPEEIKVWAAMNLQRKVDENKWHTPTLMNLKKATDEATIYTKHDYDKWKNLVCKFNHGRNFSKRKLAKLIADSDPKYKNAFETIRKKI